MNDTETGAFGLTVDLFQIDADGVIEAKHIGTKRGAAGVGALDEAQPQMILQFLEDDQARQRVLQAQEQTRRRAIEASVRHGVLLMQESR